MKNILKISLSLILLFSVSETKAQTTVAVCQPSPCASETTQRALYTYLTGNSVQTGVVGNTAATAQLLEKLISQQTQSVPNADLGNRTLAADQDVAKTLADGTRPPSATSCRNSRSSQAGGGGGAGGDVGSSGGVPGAAAEVEDDVKRYQTPTPTLASVSKVLEGDNELSCSAENVKDKTPGCTKIGQIPQGNMISTWLSYPARLKGQTSSVSVATIERNSISHKIAQSYITIASPMSAPSVQDNYKNTTAGKVFLAYRQRYSNKGATVASAYKGILARSLTAPAPQGWSEQESLYKETFPGFKFPTQPSSNERDSFAVYSQFSKTKVAEDTAMSAPEELAKRNLELQKINARLSLRIAESLDQNNILLASILANSVDPVTRKELEVLEKNAISAAGQKGSKK